MNRKNLLYKSIYIFVLLLISACGGGDGANAGQISGGAIIEPPTIAIPSSINTFAPENSAPQAEVPYSLYTIFGNFQFDAIGPELNSIDFNIGIYPKPTAKQTESGFLIIEQDRNERFIVSFRNLASQESETLKMDADIRLVQFPEKNERYPILSSGDFNRNRWDWGIIRTGNTLKQYFRRTYSDGGIYEVRSSPIINNKKSNDSTITVHVSALWADGQASFIDAKQQIDNSSQEFEFDSDETHFNAERFQISYDQLNLGWNAENDFFIGSLDNIQISK